MSGDIGKSLKGFWLKSMEAIGNTASSIASSTKYKVNEMNLVNRRREILSDFGSISYELWQKGEKFPEPLENLLKELDDLDQMLNELRAEHITGVDTTEGKEEALTDEETPQTEPAERVFSEENGDEIPVIEVPEKEAEEDAEEAGEKDEETVSESIRKAMDDIGSAAEARYSDIEEKVDQTIDAVSDTFQKVSVKIDEGIRGLAEKLYSDDENKE